MSDFDEFWAVYPRKVGKFAAAKAYVRARKHASQEQILAGVDRYLRNRPGYADWCHPTTWLNQGRWLDEADQIPQLSESSLKLIRGAEDFLRGTH